MVVTKDQFPAEAAVGRLTGMGDDADVIGLILMLAVLSFHRQRHCVCFWKSRYLKWQKQTVLE